MVIAEELEGTPVTLSTSGGFTVEGHDARGGEGYNMAGTAVVVAEAGRTASPWAVLGGDSLFVAQGNAVRFMPFDGVQR